MFYDIFQPPSIELLPFKASQAFKRVLSQIAINNNFSLWCDEKRSKVTINLWTLIKARHRHVTSQFAVFLIDFFSHSSQLKSAENSRFSKKKLSWSIDFFGLREMRRNKKVHINSNLPVLSAFLFNKKFETHNNNDAWWREERLKASKTSRFSVRSSSSASPKVKLHSFMHFFCLNSEKHTSDSLGGRFTRYSLN